MAFISGPYRWYVVYYDDTPITPVIVTNPLGVTTDPPRHRRRGRGEEIVADAVGGQAIEWINMGFVETLDIVLAEWNLNGVHAVMSSQGTLRHANTDTSQIFLGCPAVASRGFMLFGKAIGPCANPKQWIARQCSIPPDFSIDVFLGSRAKLVPLTIQCYPYAYPNASNYVNAKIYCHEEYNNSDGTIPDSGSLTAHSSMATYLANVPT